jgi:hypothetical protein
MTNESHFDTSKLTYDMLVQITSNQLKHTSDLSASNFWLNSDESFDYVSSAIALSQTLLDLVQDAREISIHLITANDLDDLAKLLDSGLQEYASDGICKFLYDLKPKSLADIDSPYK